MRHQEGIDEEPSQFGLALRIPLVAFGIVSLLSSFPVGYIVLVVMGGAHANPLGRAMVVEWLMRLALLAVPVLLIVLGVTSIRCIDRTGLRLMGVVIALIPIALLLAWFFEAVSIAT